MISHSAAEESVCDLVEEQIHEVFGHLAHKETFAAEVLCLWDAGQCLPLHAHHRVLVGSGVVHQGAVTSLAPAKLLPATRLLQAARLPLLMYEACQSWHCQLGLADRLHW